ncbi:hypothetical protein [Nannocystis pusilla]|uniref:hypothetical protein n=1 Tax=Nannocystis pusilla TaxID=889268 RepID=UPI003B7FBAC6
MILLPLGMALSGRRTTRSSTSRPRTTGSSHSHAITSTNSSKRTSVWWASCGGSSNRTRRIGFMSVSPGGRVLATSRTSRLLASRTYSGKPPARAVWYRAASSLVRISAAAGAGWRSAPLSASRVASGTRRSAAGP